MKTIKFTIFTMFMMVGITLSGQNNLPQDHPDESKSLIINGEPQENYMKRNFLNRGDCDTLLSFITPTEYPLGIAWDGQFLWHSNDDNSSIYKIDTLGNILDTIFMPRSLGGLEFDGTNLWGVMEQLSTLYKIDISDGTYVSYSLPAHYGDPNVWGVTYGGGSLWVSEYGDSSRLYKIDPVTIDVTETFTINTNIMGIKWIDSLIYAINHHDQKIYTINPSNGVLIDSADWCIPGTYDITAENNYLWAVSESIAYGGNQKIYKVDFDLSILTSTPQTENIKNELLNLYPNPAIEEITIEILQNIMSKDIICEIINTEGQIVRNISLKNQKTKIDIRSINSGIYIVKVKSENGVMVKKLIKG